MATEAPNGRYYQLGETDDHPICEAIQDGYSKDAAGPGIFILDS